MRLRNEVEQTWSPIANLNSDLFDSNVDEAGVNHQLFQFPTVHEDSHAGSKVIMNVFKELNR